MSGYQTLPLYEVQRVREKSLYEMCMGEKLIKNLVDAVVQEIEDGNPLPQVFGVDTSGDWKDLF